jgi:hypothetical protein
MSDIVIASGRLADFRNSVVHSAPLQPRQQPAYRLDEDSTDG